MAASVSTSFKNRLASGYQLISRIEVLTPQGAVLLDSDNTATPLNVVGGTIRCDRTSSFRRYVENLTIVDETGSYIPTLPGDTFSTVSGNELRLSVGMISDQGKEYVVQGYFGLQGARTRDTVQGVTIELSAYDRGRLFSRARRVTPKVFDAVNSTPIASAITSTLQDALPGAIVNTDTGASTYLTPSQTCNSGDDPWEFCRGLADSIGYELFIDRLGNIILQRIPDPNSKDLLTNWIYTEGVNATLLEVDRAQDTEQVFNGIVVTGMNPSSGLPPVRVLVWDDNPASPTYYAGPFGRHPDFYQSDTIVTVQQATDAGIGRLNNMKGLNEQITFSIVPNPAMEPTDVIQLVRTKSKFPAGGSPLIVDSFEINLLGSAAEMQVTCRPRRLF